MLFLYQVKFEKWPSENVPSLGPAQTSILQGNIQQHFSLESGSPQDAWLQAKSWIVYLWFLIHLRYSTVNFDQPAVNFQSHDFTAG